MPRLIFLLLFLALLQLHVSAALAQQPNLDGSPPSPSFGPSTGRTSTKIIPLPIYATLPNEGNTYGFMPVFMTVENATQHTNRIMAPSITWNGIIRYTGTFRLFEYPTDDMVINFIPSVSSHINNGVTLEFFNLPRHQGHWTTEGFFYERRSVFYRFFGIGPQTKSGGESSYTRVGGEAGGRIGYSVTDSFNIGFKAQLERELVERKHVGFLPLSTDVFPGTPGFGGATNVSQTLSLRYDTRTNHEYSTTGFWSELQAGVSEPLAGDNFFGKFSWEGRLLWPELDWVYGGARVYWGYTAGSNIPFFDQSSLGGSFLLRGFTQDRFIDKGAWTVELEQRITAFRTRIYGVVADWRIDPFVALGQVYADVRDFARYTKAVGGIGFRAFVHPNVLGRVDTAVGGEGIKVYVELGYPF